jgi:hypothetical protein
MWIQDGRNSDPVSGMEKSRIRNTVFVKTEDPPYLVAVTQPPEYLGEHVPDGVQHLVVVVLERHLQVQA